MSDARAEETMRGNDPASSHDPALEQALLEQALCLIAKKGWVAFQPCDLFASSGALSPSLQTFSLAEIRSYLPSKESVLTLFSRLLSCQVHQEPFDFSATSTVHERVFEVMMQRFDKMMPYRKALKSIQDFYLASPLSAFGGLDFLSNSLDDILALSNVPSSFVDKWALAVVYGLVLKTWAEDDAPDLSKTMAHLDQLLGTVFAPVN